MTPSYLYIPDRSSSKHWQNDIHTTMRSILSQVDSHLSSCSLSAISTLTHSMSGYLKIKSCNLFNRTVWKRRLFLLAENELFLFASDAPETIASECYLLKSQSQAFVCPEGIYVIEVHAFSRDSDLSQILYLQCDGEKDMLNWLKAFKNVYVAAPNSCTLSYSSNDSFFSELLSSSVESKFL
jgi:hypothetical protein